MDSSLLTQQAATIADHLGETERPPRRTIANALRELGYDMVLDLVEHAAAIEAAGGMWLDSEQRRRTFGGVFFVLLREALTPEQRKQIFATPPRQRRATQPSSAAASAPAASTLPHPALPPLTTRRELVATLHSAPGKVHTMKVTLIGRPGRIIERPEYVMTLLTYIPKQDSYPRGVPLPPADPTPCTVYIGAKQWRKVATAIQNPEDVLIVEGVLAFDRELEGLSVHATNVTTKLLQQQQRQ